MQEVINIDWKHIKDEIDYFISKKEDDYE